jgi:hypothetical protein
LPRGLMKTIIKNNLQKALAEAKSEAGPALFGCG